MQRFRAILIGVFLAAAPLIGFSAEAVEAAPAAQHAEEGLSPSAGEIGRLGPFPITNSMLVTWIVALGLIIFAQVATRNMKQIPSGAQNFWEWMVESLHNFLDGIIGHHLVHKTFWF